MSATTGLFPVRNYAFLANDEDISGDLHATHNTQERWVHALSLSGLNVKVKNLSVDEGRKPYFKPLKTLEIVLSRDHLLLEKVSFETLDTLPVDHTVHATYGHGWILFAYRSWQPHNPVRQFQVFLDPANYWSLISILSHSENIDLRSFANPDQPACSLDFFEGSDGCDLSALERIADSVCSRAPICATSDQGILASTFPFSETGCVEDQEESVSPIEAYSTLEALPTKESTWANLLCTSGLTLKISRTEKIARIHISRNGHTLDYFKTENVQKCLYRDDVLLIVYCVRGHTRRVQVSLESASKVGEAVRVLSDTGICSLVQRAVE